MDEFLTLNFPANDLVLLPGTPNDDELSGSLQNEGLLGYGGNDLAIGYGGNDWLFGNEGNDRLYGNEGADVLQGGKANDLLFGGSGNDVLFGDLGNDRLSGEKGRDTLVGGEGQDRFAIGSTETDLANADVILDYSAGEDWLELTDGLTFANLEIVAGTGANANDTILLDRLTGEYVAVLQGFDRSGGTEFGNDEMTLIRLHQTALPVPEDPNPIEPSVESNIQERADLNPLEAFRTDPRFANINGSGYATVIIDSGIDLDHPFFGSDLNNDGVADRIVYHQDFADNDNDASDRNGHGTHISSIVASEDSTYPGIAPGADIIHLKVVSDDRENTANWRDLEEALQWVVENAEEYNIASVNMSLALNNFSTFTSQYGLGNELEMLAQNNIIVVAASGNDFEHCQRIPGVAYPAADFHSISVGALDNNDGITRFSQRHPDLTDVFAPGTDITGAGLNGTTEIEKGTSQAAAYVTGVAVLAQQLAEQELDRRLTFEEFYSLLQETGVEINDSENPEANYKRVDVLALAEAIVAIDPPTPESSPESSELVRYDFTYYYDGGTTDNDYYTGYVYGQEGDWEVGTSHNSENEVNEAGFDGLYQITESRTVNTTAQAGEVYVERYYDVDSSGESYTPYFFENEEASGFRGIGSEFDFIEDNGNFENFYFGLDSFELDFEEVDFLEEEFDYFDSLETDFSEGEPTCQQVGAIDGPRLSRDGGSGAR